MREISKNLRKLITIFLMVFSINSFAQNEGFVPGKIRVKLTQEAVDDMSAQPASSKGGILSVGVQTMDALAQTYGVNNMQRVFRHAGRNEAKHIKHGLHLWYQIDMNLEANISSVVNNYLNSKDVQIAEGLRAKTLEVGAPKYMDNTEVTYEGLPFNDPYLGAQWHYHNNGTETWEETGADINAYKAWEINTGSTDIVVSIVDGGIDIDHKDLAGALWVNINEKDGDEDIDNDNNGYVDDVNGYNFIRDDARITAHFHGTHVAGTVGAVNNNGVGVAGVAGGSGSNDGVRLMSCQVFDEAGGVGNFAEAIVYGADNGAVISQNSWGYTRPGSMEQSVADAIDYFISEAGKYAGSPMSGGVVIFAAGNSGSNGDYYPGFYESAIAVSGLGPNYKKAGYSNYGTWTDIASYGGAQALDITAGVLSTLPDDKYGYLQGTSMACPHVSGIAALIVSQFGSDEFTNQDLRSRLFSGVDNVDMHNEDYVGQLGIGISNAYLAIAVDNGVAPELVDDLALTGISQDYATFSWTNPTDDDGTPASYKVYYSESEITQDNFASASMMEIENDIFSAEGDLIETQVSNLEFQTMYYFVVTALDRWGNESLISNVIKGTTNEGPGASIITETIASVIDVSSSSVNQEILQIENTKSGILTYNIETRTIKVKLSYNNVEYPVAKTGSATRNIDLMVETVDNSDIEIVSAPKLASWEKTNMLSANLSVFIGDSDSTLTVSSATKFYVSSPEGFNLTRISANMSLDVEDGPFVVEIYKGDAINKSNLLLVEQGQAPYRDTYKNYYTTLSEHLFFEEGESFWVVYHAPAGNVYPLGAGSALEQQYSDNSYVSLDMGKSWMLLSEAFAGGYAWNVKVESTVAPLGDYISFDPAEGTINGVGTQDVNMSISADKIMNGVYDSNVVLNSNDTENSPLRIPLKVTVAGHQPILSTANIVDFGSLFVGTEKEVIVEVENIGLGNFVVLSKEIDNADFELVGYVSKIAAKASIEVKLKFTPSATGSINANFTLVSKSGVTHVIRLHGVGETPPVVTIAPEETFLTDVAMGNDDIVSTFSINNVGAYPLTYALPAFVDDLSIVEADLGAVSKFGYAYEMNNNPAEFVWEDIRTTGTDITDFYTASTHNKYYRVALGFDFQYFGESVDSMYITNYGLLSLTTKSAFNSTAGFLKKYNPEGMISAMFHMLDLVNGGSIHYKRYPGSIVIQYTDMFRNLDNVPDRKITFQIIIKDSGDIEFKYQRFVNYGAREIRAIHIGIENREITDGLAIKNYYDRNGLILTDSTTISVKSPGRGIITSATNTSGVIDAGGSVDVDVTISASKLNEGNFDEYLTVLSNDPVNKSKLVRFNVDVNSGGNSELTLNVVSKDYGDLFQNVTLNDVFEIKNIGTKAIDLSSMAFENDNFTVNNFEALSINAKQTYFVEVSLKTDAVKSITDKLIITDGDGATLTADFTANVIEGPMFATDKTEYSMVLNSGEKALDELVVTNDGGHELELTIAGTEWLQAFKSEIGFTSTQGSDIPEFSYAYRTSKMENGPTYVWQNLDNPVALSYPDISKDFWDGVELPFEFEFYNQKFSKLYIGFSGIISFDEQTVAYLFGHDLGDDSEPYNVIAPYWGVQGYSASETSGVFYQVYEDKIVVTWNEFIGPFGFGDPYSFQAIIHKNGTIKFQYKLPAYADMRNSVTGIKNGDATDHIQIQRNQNYFTENTAIEFIPSQKYRVSAGESQTFDLSFDATNMIGGDYNSTLLVQNNTALSPVAEIPVSLKVNGEALVTFSEESLDLGEVMTYERNTVWRSYYANISVINSGNAVDTIKSISFKNGTHAKLQEYVFNRDYWIWEWVDFPLTLDAPIVFYPQDKLNYRVVVTPNVVDGNTLEDVLVVTSTLPTNAEIALSALPVLPPVFELDNSDIEVLSIDDNSETIVTREFSNMNGQAELEYSLSVGYNRTAPASVAQYTANSPYSNAILSQIEVDVNSASVQNVEDYATVLEYDTEEVPATLVGYGEGTTITLATAYSAPETGFNLSAISTWYAPGDMLKSDIVVRVLVGSDISTAVTVSELTYAHEMTEPDPSGSYLTIDLGTEIELYPYERFYVVLEYAMNIAYPQGIAKLDKNLPQTFYVASSDGEWYDAGASNGIYGHGWMMKAMEVTKGESNWLTINSSITGIVDNGTTSDIELGFHASRALQEDSYATLTVLTNDPELPMSEVTMHMRSNQGPVIGGAPIHEHAMNEGEVYEVSHDVVDAEGHAITSVVLEEANDLTELTYADGVVNFKYSPSFEEQGTQTFIIVADDEHGKVSKTTISVDVWNVNRAPVAKELDKVELTVDNPEYKVNLSDVIFDADNEQLTYTFETSQDNKVEIFASSTNLLIKPVGEGTVIITITGTDNEGEKAVTTLEVLVHGGLSIDDMLFNRWSVYPNPVKDVMQLYLGDLSSSDVQVNIYNTNGSLVLTSDISRGENEAKINVEGLKTGVYLVKLSTEIGDTVREIIIE